MMNEREFCEALAKRGLFLSNEQMKQFNDYAAFLVAYNEKVNLTAITDYEDILLKHFYDSLLPGFRREMKGRLVDVGSGAGFPGVVLKIAYPELEVILLEPLKKRCVFLEELIGRLGLKGISVVNERGEDYSLIKREAYDYVTARAVSNLNMLIEVCGAMVKKGGYFIALRGHEGIAEIERAARAIKTMGFVVEDTYQEHLADGSLRVISFFKKESSCKDRFPRKYSIIKQKPL